jgi:hypothetical protein
MKCKHGNCPFVSPKQEGRFTFELQEAAVAYARIQQTWQDAIAGASWARRSTDSKTKKQTNKKSNSVAFSSRANYTDRATAAFQRN